MICAPEKRLKMGRFKIVELNSKMMDRPMQLSLLEMRACRTRDSVALDTPIPKIQKKKRTK